MGAGNSANKDQKKAAELAFQTFDTDKNKKMSTVEFEAMLKKHGIDVPASQYALAFDLVDSNDSGMIEHKEFTKLYNFMKAKNFTVTFFDLIAFAGDTNGDGTYDKKELKIVYKHYKHPMDAVEEAKYKKAKLSKDEFLAVVKELMK